MKKTLLAVAAATALTLSGVASAAPVFLDFTVDNSAFVPELNETSFVADKLNGGYAEQVTISALGQVVAAAYANFGTFFANQGADIINAGTSRLGVDYGLYALFTSTAQVVGSNFIGTSGTFSLYLDNDLNTINTLTAGVLNGSGLITSGPSVASTANFGDDVLLASSSTMRVNGASIGSIAITPAFDFLFDATSLTAEGMSFFVKPNPFYLTAEIDGNIVGLNTLPGNYTVTGAANVTFNDVPEPGSLALLGLGLAGLGFAKRRSIAK